MGFRGVGCFGGSGSVLAAIRSIVDFDQDLTDLDPLAFCGSQPQNGAGYRGREFGTGFVGEHFYQGLVAGHQVTYSYQPLHDFGFFEAFTDIGEEEPVGHVVVPVRPSRAYDAPRR